MDDAIKILNVFINMIKSGDYVDLFLIVVFVLAVVLFKEFRKNKMELDKVNNQRISEALQLYGNAILSIRQYKSNNSEVLNDLILLYPYATKEIVQLIDKVSIEQTDELYKEIIDKLNSEINRLKLLQYDSVAFKFNKYSDLIYYYYKKNNFSLIITPLIQTFMAICITLYVLLIIISYDNKSTLIGKTIVMINFCAIIWYALMVISTMDIIDDKIIEKNILSLIAIILFIMSPLIFCISFGWITEIIFLVYLIVYSTVILRIILKPRLPTKKIIDKDV